MANAVRHEPKTMKKMMVGRRVETRMTLIVNARAAVSTRRLRESEAARVASPRGTQKQSAISNLRFEIAD
jgi:hypothetical protein